MKNVKLLALLALVVLVQSLPGRLYAQNNLLRDLLSGPRELTVKVEQIVEAQKRVRMDYLRFLTESARLRRKLASSRDDTHLQRSRVLQEVLGLESEEKDRRRQTMLLSMLTAKKMDMGVLHDARGLANRLTHSLQDMAEVFMTPRDCCEKMAEGQRKLLGRTRRVLKYLEDNPDEESTDRFAYQLALMGASQEAMLQLSRNLFAKIDHGLIPSGFDKTMAAIGQDMQKVQQEFYAARCAEDVLKRQESIIAKIDEAISQLERAQQQHFRPNCDPIAEMDRAYAQLKQLATQNRARQLEVELLIKTFVYERLS